MDPSTDEQRILNEIERSLGVQDPRLAKLLTKRTKLTQSPWFLLYVLMASPVGIVAAAIGTKIQSPLLVTLGIAVWAVLPVAGAWHFARQR